MFGVGGDSGSSMFRALCSALFTSSCLLVGGVCYRISFSVISAYVVAITHTRILFYFDAHAKRTHTVLHCTRTWAAMGAKLKRHTQASQVCLSSLRPSLQTFIFVSGLFKEAKSRLIWSAHCAHKIYEG